MIERRVTEDQVEGGDREGTWLKMQTWLVVQAECRVCSSGLCEWHGDTGRMANRKRLMMMRLDESYKLHGKKEMRKGTKW